MPQTTHDPKVPLFQDGRPRYTIQDDGCWRWNGTKTPGGYGLVRSGKLMIYAHRDTYSRAFGSIPEGMDLDHAVCQNPSCVNPDHLEAVTRAENVRRGRAAKLTADDVTAIRHAASNGISQIALARQYGVAPCTVGRAVARSTWSDID
jgi:hypothetical protein